MKFLADDYCKDVYGTEHEITDEVLHSRHEIISTVFDFPC